MLINSINLKVATFFCLFIIIVCLQLVVNYSNNISFKRSVTVLSKKSKPLKKLAQQVDHTAQKNQDNRSVQITENVIRHDNCFIRYNDCYVQHGSNSISEKHLLSLFPKKKIGIKENWIFRTKKLKRKNLGFSEQKYGLEKKSSEEKNNKKYFWWCRDLVYETKLHSWVDYHCIAMILHLRTRLSFVTLFGNHDVHHRYHNLNIDISFRNQIEKLNHMPTYDLVILCKLIQFRIKQYQSIFATIMHANDNNINNSNITIAQFINLETKSEQNQYIKVALFSILTNTTYTIDSQSGLPTWILTEAISKTVIKYNYANTIEARNKASSKLNKQIKKSFGDNMKRLCNYTISMQTDLDFFHKRNHTNV